MLIRWMWLSGLIILWSYLFLLQIEAIWPFTIDDMYITLRYAHHWASGAGLVWNMNEPAVEGYSNFIYVLLARIAEGLNIDPVLVLKWMGVGSLFISTLLLYLLSRRWSKPALAIIPCIWLLVYRGEIIWSVSGLETTFYQSMVLAAVYCLIKSHHRFFAVYSGIFLVLMGLTRPEGIILAFIFSAIFLYFHHNANTHGFMILPVIGVLLPYSVWRWWYFGYLFPNPVYCKGFSESFGQVDMAYLKLLGPFLLLTLPWLWKSKERTEIKLLFGLPSLIYLILCARADPIVAFDNRLFLPAFALWLPLTLASLTNYFKQDWKIYAVSLLLFLGLPKLTLKNYRQFSVNPVQGTLLRTVVAEWIGKNVPISHQILLADCGLIPQLKTDYHFIDSYCLNNLSMAHDFKENRYELFCKQVVQTKPEVIILTAWHHRQKTIFTPTDACLAPLLTKSSEYHQVADFRTTLPGDYYQYLIYQKRG